MIYLLENFTGSFLELFRFVKTGVNFHMLIVVHVQNVVFKSSFNHCFQLKNNSFEILFPIVSISKFPSPLLNSTTPEK